MQEKPIITFEDVHYSYHGESHGGNEAVSGVSFDIHPGELVCFVGRNGSGKSTIAKLIDGLITPTIGKVSAFGFDTTNHESAFGIRSRIGYVFQNPIDQIVNTVVENEVAFGPENLGLSTEEIRKRVDDSLVCVNMSEHACSNVNKLSGGQLQRIALADALAMNPDVLIFDEATSMLDPDNTKQFLELVKKLHLQGKTIIMITHSEEEAKLGSRLIALEHGCIKYDGNPNEEIIASMFPEFPSRLELDRLYPNHMEQNCPRSPRSTCRQSIHDALRDSSHGMSQNASTQHHAPYNTPHDALHKVSESPTKDDPVVLFDGVDYSYDVPKKHFKNRTDVLTNLTLQDIDLSINDKDSVAIMGANGSGKSTLIKHMNGLIKPNRGTIFVDGISTADKDGANRARRIVGICFQYPEKQLFAQSVYDDIAYGPINEGLSKEEIDKRVRNAMQEVSLDFDTYAGKNPFTLSGGEQRRVALAGTLATNPDILVLDEPCASLDPQTHIEFLHLIARLKSMGRTIVIVTHDKREADLLTDRVVRLENGRIVQQ